MNVGTGIVPRVDGTASDFDCVPKFVVGHSGFVLIGEHLRLNRSADCVGDFLCGRPDLFQKYVFAVTVLADRFGNQIDVGAASKCVGNYQWRAGQVVGFCVWVHAAFEVTVATEDGRCNQVARLNRIGDGFGKRSAVADAGRAAVAHRVETKLV